MQINPTALDGVLELVPRFFKDERGFFVESYSRRHFIEAGITQEFVQDNHSLSRPEGTVRGMHFQIGAAAQAKLLRVARGRILDVVVDLRRASPTFGQHIGMEISAEQGNQIYVPAGFAHGFCTLEPDTEVLYKVDKYYSPDHDRGIAWDDPDLGIKWPVTPDQATLSGKDRTHPRLKDCPDLF